MTWRDTGKWVLHLAPLIWWGGLASYVRVRSATPGNPPVGDLAATVPFMAIGLVALAAIVWLRKSDLKLLTTVFVAPNLGDDGHDDETTQMNIRRPAGVLGRRWSYTPTRRPLRPPGSSPARRA